MLSPATFELPHAARYVEEYLDLVESLPFDLQRNVSLMREIDAKYQGEAWCPSYVGGALGVGWVAFLNLFNDVSVAMLANQS